MEYDQEIILSPEMNESCLENLRLRGDNVSLYAIKWIEELQKQIL